MATVDTVIPMGESYPFRTAQDGPCPRGKVQVRKTLEYGLEPRFVMKEKIRMLKNLGFQHLVALEATAEAENHLDLLFEFTPFSFQLQLPSLAPQTIERVREGMYQLAESLATKGVEHEFRIENMGLDRKEGLKYFLGFAFKIDRGMNKEDTLQRYRRIIDFFFASGGPLVKGRSPAKSLRNETADSSSKGAESSSKGAEEASHALLPSANLMKKSSTVDNSPIFPPPNRQLLTRYTFNCNNELALSPAESQGGFEEERRVETKAVKMDELGARINKLKSYMKEITGKTPTGSSGLAKFSVKVDANNFENKIFQENKIMITPSYTKLEKKISEFRESKLYRAYNEKEILYSKNNQGYQVLTTHKIQDNSKGASQNPELKAITQPQGKTAMKAIESVQTEPSRPSRPEGHVPSFFLQKKESINSAKHSPATSPKSQAARPLPTEPSPSLKGSSSNKSSPFDSVRGAPSVLPSKSVPDPSDPQEKEYRQLATKDKYCEEFMFFLEGEECGEQEDFFLPPAPARQAEEGRSNKSVENTAHNREIQDRVNKAIRNSIKLISCLKAKDA